jgi:hypothetical protein
MIRPLSAAERSVLTQLAAALPTQRSEALLHDLNTAAVEPSPDGARLVFHIAGHSRPAYRGQRLFPVEGLVLDRDGAEISVLLYADEQDRLFELELVRAGHGEPIAPIWSTLTVF